jgi:hypothetical protein
MRFRVVLFLLPVVLASVYWAYVRVWPTTISFQPEERSVDLTQEAQALSQRVSVPNNRGPEIIDGFRGDIHPLLHGASAIEVQAFWESRNDAYILGSAPPEVRRLFLNLGPAAAVRSYASKDFSAFMPPETITVPGRIWALDADRCAVFLKQFHAAPSTHMDSIGRRPGPDGAFAMLRAVSPTHLEVVFRIHAEFDLLPRQSNLPVVKAWYSPACFLGRLVVHRSAGNVEYFQLGVPTDKLMNVHVTSSNYDHDLMRVDRMELVGGKLQSVEGIRWAEQVDPAEAYAKLTKVFYKFKEIDWLPFDQALGAARSKKKPLFVVVLWGALDDQSC